MEHIDALEAVRRLTLERDALAKQLKDTNALMEKIKQSVLIDHLIPGGQDGLFHAVDWICFALRDEKKKRAAVMADRDALAEQVKRLEDSVVWHREELERTRAEWEQQQPKTVRLDCEAFTAIVEMRGKKFYAEARTATTGKMHVCGFDKFQQAADYAMLLGRELTGNAPQATERHERPETGTEPTEGPNGAPRGCEVASCERITRLAADMCATEAALSEANKVLSVWRDRAHEWRKAAKKARAVLVDTHNVMLRGSDFSEPEDWDDR